MTRCNIVPSAWCELFIYGSLEQQIGMEAMMNKDRSILAAIPGVREVTPARR
jgi:hypothetical protein